MAIPPADVQTKVSTGGAQNLIDAYYKSLNENRSLLSSFYVHPTPTYPQTADISLNGNIVSDPASVQHIFETKMPKARYEVQCFDCHVVNPNYNVGVTEEKILGPETDGRKMSLLVITSGYVKYGDSKDMRGFTENFVLVPNSELGGPKGKAKAGRRWLIQSQNFRLVF